MRVDYPASVHLTSLLTRLADIDLLASLSPCIDVHLRNVKLLRNVKMLKYARMLNTARIA